MNILITGAGGLLGSEFVRAALSRGHAAVGADRAALDVTAPGEVRDALEGSGFDWVVHCAAYTAVDRAEHDMSSARVVNVDGARNVARAAREAGTSMAYLSTDYVFDGAIDRPYRVADLPNPLSAYGRTKWDGERAVADMYRDTGSSTEGLGPTSLIVRTGWLYGEGGRGFVRTMIDRARRGESLRIVDDQRGRPTYAGHVARTVLELMDRRSVDARMHAAAGSSIWHVADGGEASWMELAEAALRFAKVDTDVCGVSSEEFGAAARRPAYSVLDLTETERVLGREMPDWRDALRAVLTASER